MQLTVDIYQLAGSLPPSERPGLSTDLQHAAAAIPTLIATGHKTRTRSGMANACQRALQNAAELETLLILVGNLFPNVPSNDLLDQLDEVQQMLQALIQRLSGTSGPKTAL
jgi:four helix bundle protein